MNCANLFLIAAKTLNSRLAHGWFSYMLRRGECDYHGGGLCQVIVHHLIGNEIFFGRHPVVALANLSRWLE